MLHHVFNYSLVLEVLGDLIGLQIVIRKDLRLLVFIVIYLIELHELRLFLLRVL